METGRISSWQFFQLMLSLVLGLQLGRVPPFLVQIAGPDAWISMLLALGIDLAVAGALYVLGRRFPGRTLFEYPPLVLGRVLGKAVAVSYIWLFLHAAALSIYAYAAFYKLVLPETPLLVFVLLVAVVNTVGAYHGLETLARASEFIGPVSVAISALILILSIKDMDFGNLQPVLANGIRTPIEAALVPASWFGVCVVMGLLMAYHNKPEQAFVAKASGVSAGTIVLTLLVLGSLAVLGPVQAAHQRTPIWSLTRLISVSGFFERVQMLFISLLMTTGFVTLGVLHYASSLGISQVFGLKEYRPLVLPVGLILTALAFGLVDSNLDAQPFFREAFPPYALTIEGGLTFLILIVALVRGSRAPLPQRRRRAQEGSGGALDAGTADGGRDPQGR